ncbi:hypothetical protein BpHYR1_032339 [Brachionus plicatilis]|uniref:Uncharacterized protein n=1 Tax=Brachionus plicatilis TaxID=10195 RepID=A0A3M7QC29_BRAPC|nr:hypothetical protein BpHYR1_032339 [Brachionus plicatilis]
MPNLVNFRWIRSVEDSISLFKSKEKFSSEQLLNNTCRNLTGVKIFSRVSSSCKSLLSDYFVNNSQIAKIGSEMSKLLKLKFCLKFLQQRI